MNYQKPVTGSWTIHVPKDPLTGAFRKPSNARGLFQHLPPSWQEYRAHDPIAPQYGYISSPRKNGKKSLQKIINVENHWPSPDGSFGSLMQRARLSITVTHWLIGNYETNPVKIEQINHLWKGPTMKREITEDQLREILTTADAKMGETNDELWMSGTGDDTNLWSELELASLRAILDAIPEEDETEPWQECGPEDLREDDRYLLQGKNWHFEGGVYADPTQQHVVLAYHPNNGHLIHAGPDTVTLFDQKNTTLYRIPAPVVHPDPEVHQYILAHKFDDNPAWALPAMGEANDERTGYYINGLFRDPTRIVEWQQLKVAEDE